MNAIGGQILPSSPGLSWQDGGEDGPAVIYAHLMAVAANDPFDAHVFACNIALSHVLDRLAPGHGLGLSGTAFKRLLDVYFPGSGLSTLSATGEDALEEADLRALLLSGRAKGTMTEEWLAAIVARACQRPNHLWQDLGLGNRGELSQMMNRHFPGIAAGWQIGRETTAVGHGDVACRVHIKKRRTRCAPFQVYSLKCLL